MLTLNKGIFAFSIKTRAINLLQSYSFGSCGSVPTLMRNDLRDLDHPMQR